MPFFTPTPLDVLHRIDTKEKKMTTTLEDINKNYEKCVELLPYKATLEEIRKAIAENKVTEAHQHLLHVIQTSLSTHKKDQDSMRIIATRQIELEDKQEEMLRRLTQLESSRIYNTRLNN